MSVLDHITVKGFKSIASIEELKVGIAHRSGADDDATVHILKR